MMDYQDLINRRKIAYLRPEDLAGFFGNWAKRDTISLPVYDGLEGAMVVDVFADFARRSIAVIFAREDWDEVEPGHLPPYVVDPAKLICVTRKLEEML